jgi:hypothetical protein
MRISNLSIENLTVHIVTPGNVDPTALAVSFAFTGLGGEPTSWSAGTWTGGTGVTSDGRPAWVAETALLGPAQTHALTEGRYHCWYQIVDGAETIRQQYDELEVY